MKRTYFIYKLTSPSGKVYIGQTYNINRRFSSYRNLQCKYQNKLYSSILKYGWDKFKKEIIYDGVCSKNDIDKLEQTYIDIYFNNSLNIAEKVNSPIYKTGKSHPRSKPIIQFDLKLNKIKEWENASEASKVLSISQSDISKACRTSNFYAGGYYWRFLNDYTQEDLLILKEKPHYLSQPIIQLSKNFEFIKEWESQSKASKELKINQSTIWRVLCGKGISAGGFIWIKKIDYEN